MCQENFTRKRELKLKSSTIKCEKFCFIKIPIILNFISVKVFVKPPKLAIAEAFNKMVSRKFATYLKKLIRFLN
jgi:hypothetical protein